MGYTKNRNFYRVPIPTPESPNFCARRSQAACHGQTSKTAVVLEQNCCRPNCHHHVSPSRVLRAPGTSPYHLVPRGLGLSNPTSFLRSALPMAPTRDDNARDKRSVLEIRPNPATFLRDFALYMTLKYAIIRKRCLN